MSAVRFSAVVLAAGASTRMPGRHKLLLPVGRDTVIGATLRAVLASGPGEVVVVTGHGAQDVAAALAGLPVRIVYNPRHAEGQMTSVAAGVAALGAGCDAVMVCLGDMALLGPEDYRELSDAWATRPRGSILVPRRGDERGNPVLFGAHHIPAIIAGERNLGCRRLIADHPDEVFAYAPAHDRFFVDLDTPEDYERLLERLALPAEGAALAG